MVKKISGSTEIAKRGRARARVKPQGPTSRAERSVPEKRQLPTEGKNEVVKRSNTSPKTIGGGSVQKRVLSGEVVKNNKSEPKKLGKAGRVFEGKAETKPVTSQKSLGSKVSSTAKSVAKKAVGGVINRAAVGTAIASGVIAAHKAFGVGDYKKGPANVDSQGKSTKIDMTKKSPEAKQVTPTKKPSAPKSTAKSATRVAFEKEFAKQRKSGAKEFTFRGKKYNTKLK